MADHNTCSLFGETLVTLDEASKDFGGIEIPIRTVRKYVYNGINGVKLETVNINRRYTSKEAILRFIERKQNPEQPTKPKIPKMSQAEVAAILKKHGISR
jgi:hypothetical protein